jgi:hypothetical protein
MISDAIRITTQILVCASVMFINISPLSCEEFDFIEEFLRYPTRMGTLPQNDPDTKNLLTRFRPRVFVSEKSYLPMDFYRDYLPRCVVKQNKNEIIYPSIEGTLLEDIQGDPSVFLDFLPSVATTLDWTISDVNPVLYGRVYKDTLVSENTKIDLLFLKYSCVFPYSGLPEKNHWWKTIGASLLGNKKGWHELDIHGAIHVVLEEHSVRPVGVILAQHNHHRVYLVPDDITLPSDDRILVSFSEYSNEPYLIGWDGPSRYERAVGNPMHIAYLFGRTAREPLDSGYDLVVSATDGAREIDMEMQLLAFDDPLYVAKISLGDKKKLLGIFESWTVEGPPGIDYYTLPQIKDMADLMAFWYIDPEDEKFFGLLEENFKSFAEFNVEPILEHQKKKLLEKIAFRSS